MDTLSRLSHDADADVSMVCIFFNFFVPNRSLPKHILHPNFNVSRLQSSHWV